MVKTKRSKIAIIAMAIMIVLCIASIATLAYFTSQKSTSKEIKFGTIEVDVTSANGNLVTSQSQNAVLMPGDTATVNFTVENKGEACYYLVLLTTPGATEIDLGFPTGLYAGAVDNAGTNKIATPTATTYQVGSFAASSAAEGKSFTYNENVAFSLTDIGNEAQGKSVTVCVTVVAIQQANMEAGSDTLSATEYAYQELYKMLYPAVDQPVVVNGVKYFYDSTTDSFKVGDGGATVYVDFPLGNGYASLEIAESQTEFIIEPVILGRAVTEITNDAFSDQGGGYSTSITKIIIPDTVISIGEYAFSGSWASVMEITIPNSVTLIKEGAFQYWSNAEKITINYAGTMAEWNNITIDGNWNQDTLKEASIVCSDGTMINGVVQG